ncbi:HlyD family efflux transporter periplasmic adaptor subunit [Flavitalea sp. BT771]|uniref:HlyD family secretion protein n=1 Tax=Flavitalea sp. BT771 TaxID=3063329 RepID=UPI0026E33BFD|nr:HlyD family efflux transporter periplasmic adaptor subunit [Flavitalea sp. BT771]MDO6434795.1 HlyD family efflux transporter periplasmic adaptor subunit [Flavitalea sp. BT771]MDV6223695.1 HlyD family efflux transporter periplasmic adaptor subunit [Flavitalea sp. BT771]
MATDLNVIPHTSMSKNGQKASFRSEEAIELLLARKSFFSTWALLLFLILILILFVVAWFVRYPDIIQANATLTARNAVKEINVRQSGKLIELFVSNDEQVHEDQTIGWIESVADHRQVIRLSVALDKSVKIISMGQMEQISELFTDKFKDLGELQPAYQQFLTAMQQFNDYLVNGYYQKRRAILLKDLEGLEKISATLSRQGDLSRQDLNLTSEELISNDTLYKYKVISSQDMRTEHSKFISKQMNLSQAEMSLLSNANEQRDKQKEINELEHTISQQNVIFQQAIETLKSAVDDWRKKYIIESPIEGRVVFIIPLQRNQLLQAGKQVGFVNPSDTRYYAQVNLPQGNFGKISLGQKVQLRFDAYPYEQYGTVDGILDYISKVPSDSGFLANIELPNGLATNQKKEIQYYPGLKSQALIITEDLRLLQRLFYKLVKGTDR